MLYEVRLSISYSYQSPAAASRTLLRMTPRDLPDQQVTQSRIYSSPPPSFRISGRDFFGNITTELAHDMLLDRIEFLYEGRVQRYGEETTLDLSGPVSKLKAEIAASRSIAPESPHHFIGPSTRVPEDPEIATFARDVTDTDMSTLETLRAVCKAVHDGFDFDPDATHVGTTPSEAFSARRGVCQDFSHVAISALRSLGVPAAYVSGFLRTEPPEGQPRLEGADAMHAWVRAWCGQENGWIEFDPTNDVLVAGDHITVALGRDYSDVAPVKGTLRTVGDHMTAHAVDVVPIG